MNAFAIAVVVLACVFGGTLAGLYLKSFLPGHHLKDDSKDIVKLGIGVIATMTALVLGLLVSSAKGSFDRTSTELTQIAAKIIELDRVLVHYGPETREVRVALKQSFATVIGFLFSDDKEHIIKLADSERTGHLERAQDMIQALAPKTDTQRELRAQALALAGDLAATRWLLLLQERETISMPLLVVVVSWLSLIFMGFGLFSPRNGTVVIALFLCALSVSGAVFLILEMDRPLEGMVRISDAPMRTALKFLGQ
jgi:hypothetical protein